MKPLLKVMLVLGSVFAATFILGRLLGIFTVENVRQWLQLAQNVDSLWVAAIVVALLFVDLFVAVPTLTITILAGFLLGFPAGAAAAFTGMSIAAFSGYSISRVWGDRGIALVVSDEHERQKMAQSFSKYGPVMITLSRAAPIVPEVTACMAGATKMPLLHYALFFTISSLPYALVAAWAGSISSVDSPQPAIYAALSLYAILWLGWTVFRRRHMDETNMSSS